MDPLPNPRRQRARLVFFVFTLTFIASRVLVILIMTRRMPDLFLHLGGNHVHHLNYGIVLLAASGAWTLFAPPEGRTRTRVATAYAIGLALTFDEFGMWLHLGGGYWQRASFDAVVVIATILALLAFLPAPRALRPRQLAAAVIVLAGVAVFGRLVYETLDHAGQRVAPALREIEDAAPK
jgi:hypothetical protein